MSTVEQVKAAADAVATKKAQLETLKGEQARLAARIAEIDSDVDIVEADLKTAHDEFAKVSADFG